MPQARTPDVEIAVQDIRGAEIARDAGADRIELCLALGPTRVLTSGGAPRVGEGLTVLGQLAQASAVAARPVQVMAGGGAVLADIEPAIAAGVDAVHLSAKTTASGGPVGPGGGTSEWDVTDAEVVAAAVAAARKGVTRA